MNCQNCGRPLGKWRKKYCCRQCADAYYNKHQRDQHSSRESKKRYWQKMKPEPIMKPEAKTCSGCKEVLPLDAFPTHKRYAPNGKKYNFRRHLCRPCYDAYNAEYVARKNRERLEARPDRFCLGCGALLPKKDAKRVYCSPLCRRKTLHKENYVAKPHNLLECPGCGEQFKAKTKRQVYCSTACSRRPAARVTKNCEHCGKETTRRHYCSLVCWVEARRAKRNISKKKYVATEKGKEFLKRANSVKNQRRRARLAGAERTFTARDWKAALEYFGYKCAYCGKSTNDLHQEHFVPLARRGGYTRDNIIPACPTCNSKKIDKDPIEWLAGLPNALIAYARITTYFMVNP